MTQKEIEKIRNKLMREYGLPKSSNMIFILDKAIEEGMLLGKKNL